MDVIISTGYPEYVYAFELGNEPDLYGNNPDYADISGGQDAKNFDILRELIHNEYASQSYKPLIWGNDNCCNENYFTDFLSNASTKSIDSITYHQYYCNGADTQLYQFYSVKLLDELITVVNNNFNLIHKYFSNDTSVILGETSNCYGGGVRNYSASFIAGFMWLDKLGLAAAMNIKAICRQQFVFGNYALIDGDFNPNPDYFTAVIFKNLVSNKVLTVVNETMAGRAVRCYAFCTKTKSDEGEYI